MVYRYHTKSRVRIMSEPGSPGFDAELEAIALAAKIRPPEDLYFIRAAGLGLIKIGIANDLTARIRSLRTASPDKLELLGVVARAGKKAEAELHRRFAADRSHGEWFRPSTALLKHIEGLISPSPCPPLPPSRTS